MADFIIKSTGVVISVPESLWQDAQVWRMALERAAEEIERRFAEAPPR